MTNTTPPPNLTVHLPVRSVAALLELAERAPLHEAERLWLEGLKREVATALAAKMATKPGGDAEDRTAVAA